MYKTREAIERIHLLALELVENGLPEDDVADMAHVNEFFYEEEEEEDCA